LRLFWEKPVIPRRLAEEFLALIEELGELTPTDLRFGRQRIGMSDTADDIGFQGRQLLNKSKMNPLREKMRQFIDQNDEELKQLRSKVAGHR